MAPHRPAGRSRRGGGGLRLPARRGAHAPPRPALTAPARGRARALPHLRPVRPPVAGRGLEGPTAGRRGGLRDAHRDVHPRGHLRRRRGAAGPPGRARGRLPRDPPGQRLQRHPQLGLRRRALVHRARGLRRPGGLPALRRRLPPARSRRGPGRRLQPPRSQRQLPARVRAVLQRRGEHDLGHRHQLRRPRLRHRPALRGGQRADVVAGHARRRPPAGRRARPGRPRPGLRHPGAARGRDRRPQRRRRASAQPGRGVGHEQPAPDHPAPGGRLRAGRAVERRLPPRPADQPHR